MLNGRILEVSKLNKVTGRTYIKVVIHEIHNSTEEYNKNGISWKEEYVLNNIESAKTMPICAEFLDDYDKEEPFGHGESGIKDGQPVFEYSVVVGAFENAYIDNVEVNGKTIRALIGEGYIYEQRYPKFVKWLKAKMYDGDLPESSVEICAKEGYENIIYEDGWKEKGRVPKIYDYTGHAILGIEPADDSAVVLELNKNKEVKRDMSDNKTIIELNEKLEAKTNEINQLKNDIKEKDTKITELNSIVEEKENKINELNEKITTVEEQLKAKEGELETLKSEFNELKEYKEKVEKEKLINELNSKLEKFNNDEKSCVKEKVEKFNVEPSKELLDEIINEINAEIAKKVLEQRQKQVSAEQNSKIEDIYGDIYETNSQEITEDDIY
jgi:predicted  nucleic acid-binding Zn-ribbon protein